MQVAKVVRGLVPKIFWATSCAWLISASAMAQQQQYPNFEEQRSPDGGSTGTYGNQNFDLPPQPGQNASRQTRPLRPDASGGRSSSSGSTHRSCVVDSYGNAFCK